MADHDPAAAEERAAFEAWATGRDLTPAQMGDGYASPYVQNDWEVWQARAALAAPKAEAPEWATCESRGPWVRNSLRDQAKDLRRREVAVRHAYTKDYMRVPCEYVAEAYAEAAAAIERRLAIAAPPAHQGATR